MQEKYGGNKYKDQGSMMRNESDLSSQNHRANGHGNGYNKYNSLDRGGGVIAE